MPVTSEDPGCRPSAALPAAWRSGLAALHTAPQTWVLPRAQQATGPGLGAWLARPPTLQVIEGPHFSGQRGVGALGLLFALLLAVVCRERRCLNAAAPIRSLHIRWHLVISLGSVWCGYRRWCVTTCGWPMRLLCNQHQSRKSKGGSQNPGPYKHAMQRK
jgi:hypothetical protein